MKKIRLLRLAVLVVGLSVVFSVSDSTPPISGNSGDDPVPNVEVYAGRGVLKVHGQNETQYRDMASGSQSLSNGSYLMTAGGQANILLPDNSVICMDANTEIRVGMYAHGAMILQRTGIVGHSVEWRPGSNYCVDMLFGRATATGTEFFTIIDSPFEGAVSVVAGTVSFEPHSLVVDPQTGRIDPGYWTKDLTVEGEAFTVYPRNQGPAQALKWGDYFKLSIDALVNPPYVTGSKITHVTDTAWVQRNRNLLRMIEALRRARQRGRLSPRDYRQKLGALLGIGPGMIPNEPLRVQGGLWVGMDAYSQVIKFCVTGDQIDMVSYTGWVYCTDKKTHETYNYRVDFDLNEGVPFLLERNGSYIGGYEFPDGVYKGLTFLLNGFLSGSSGEAIISMFSENEVAVCNMGPTVIQLTRSPAPCVR